MIQGEKNIIFWNVIGQQNDGFTNFETVVSWIKDEEQGRGLGLGLTVHCQYLDCFFANNKSKISLKFK